jgi:hypothetical protein
LSSADRNLDTLRSVGLPLLSVNGDADCILFCHVSGGSTIVCLFEKNAVEWDEDLLINGRASLETLVRVGMGIGRRRGSPAVTVNVASTGYA